MSILSDALHKRIGWGEAAKQAIAWGEKLVKSDPSVKAAVDATVSAVKQGLSNAIAFGDTALADHMGDVMTASHSAADSALMALTGGKFPPAMLPLVNGTIDQIEQAGAAAFHAWALQAKANLITAAAAVPPAPAAPPVNTLASQNPG